MSPSGQCLAILFVFVQAFANYTAVTTVVTGEKEPQPGFRTHSLRSNAKFQPHESPLWPRFFTSNCCIYGHGQECWILSVITSTIDITPPTTINPSLPLSLPINLKQFKQPYWKDSPACFFPITYSHYCLLVNGWFGLIIPFQKPHWASNTMWHDLSFHYIFSHIDFAWDADMANVVLTLSCFLSYVCTYSSSMPNRLDALFAWALDLFHSICASVYSYLFFWQ